MTESLVVVGGPGDVVEALTTSTTPFAWLLLVNAASTLFMTGVIWFVQIVHYPLFIRVGPGVLVDYARRQHRAPARPAGMRRHRSTTTLL
jgi:hypothetical protein